MYNTIFIIFSWQKCKSYLAYRINFLWLRILKYFFFFLSANQYIMVAPSPKLLVAGSIPEAKHARWHVSLLPGLKRQKWVDLHEFEISLTYIESPRPHRSNSETLLQNQKTWSHRASLFNPHRLFLSMPPQWCQTFNWFFNLLMVSVIPSCPTSPWFSWKAPLLTMTVSSLTKFYQTWGSSVMCLLTSVRNALPIPSTYLE